MHLDFLAELNGDPEVMRHLLGRAATAQETRAEWERRLGPWSDVPRGLGYWAGRLEGELVGWWSASSVATDPAVSGVGYRLVRRAWGLGLATEGARAMLGQAFSVPGVERCAASTAAANTGSRRVLEKIGMTHVDTLPGTDEDQVVYEVRRPHQP